MHSLFRSAVGRSRLAFFCLTLFALSALAQIPVPELSARVIDSTDTLTAQQLQALNARLADFEQTAGSQVVVLMVKTTQPEDIEAFSNRVGSAWKIGRKDVGDGLLLVIAKDDHKLRIEVARALEGAVTDLSAKRVIDQSITPRFKQGDFAGGIDAGLTDIFALIRHENLPAPKDASTTPNAPMTFLQIIGFIVAAPLAIGVVCSFYLGVIGFLFGVSGTLTAILVGWVSDLVGVSDGVGLWLLVSGFVGGGVGGFFLLATVLDRFGVRSVSGTTPSRYGLTDRSTRQSSSGSLLDSLLSSSSIGSGGGGSFGGGGASGGW